VYANVRQAPGLRRIRARSSPTASCSIDYRRGLSAVDGDEQPPYALAVPVARADGADTEFAFGRLRTPIQWRCDTAHQYASLYARLSVQGLGFNVGEESYTFGGGRMRRTSVKNLVGEDALRTPGPAAVCLTLAVVCWSVSFA
jgi:hypothetical protein